LERKTMPLYELCNTERNLKDEYFLFPNLYDYWFYKVIDVLLEQDLVTSSYFSSKRTCLF
jgi:hypothetical protein